MSAAPEEYKRALSHLAGGVVIVTTRGADGEPRGMTATAVCSVSVNPPLVMACMSQAAMTHAAVDVSRVFALNFMPASARDLAEQFARSTDDKFAGVEIVDGVTGAPLIASALAHCDCEVDRSIAA
ncbi:MAG: flavin reductase family protein, partial [Gemmatimonadota bacterium]|nr:flavin reductase family protein [Gemmatimonadota bacterium]